MISRRDAFSATGGM